MQLNTHTKIEIIKVNTTGAVVDLLDSLRLQSDNAYGIITCIVENKPSQFVLWRSVYVRRGSKMGQNEK